MRRLSVAARLFTGIALLGLGGCAYPYNSSYPYPGPYGASGYPYGASSFGLFLGGGHGHHDRDFHGHDHDHDFHGHDHDHDFHGHGIHDGGVHGGHGDTR